MNRFARVVFHLKIYWAHTANVIIRCIPGIESNRKTIVPNIWEHHLSHCGKRERNKNESEEKLFHIDPFFPIKPRLNSPRLLTSGLFEVHMNLISPEIEDYCINHSSRPSQVAKEIQEYTKKNVHGSQMLIGEMEASVLRFLISLGKVKTVVEFGTYTGYSALAMAEALPEDGKVFTIDINKETTTLARSFWDKSPDGKKIQQILKPGLEAMKELTEKYDLIFIDADKNNYSNYLAWAVEHLSQDGLIVVDNTLWSGRVMNSDGDKQTESIIAHNIKAKGLHGFVKTLLPIRDGMFLLKRDQ